MADEGASHLVLATQSPLGREVVEISLEETRNLSMLLLC